MIYLQLKYVFNIFMFVNVNLIIAAFATDTSIYVLILHCLLKDHVAEYKSQDPRVDQEIIDSIDQAYFNDDHTFDIVEYHLTVCSYDHVLFTVI